MSECIGLYYSENIVFKDTSTFRDEAVQSGVVLYEVLRIVGSTALFLEDHIQRLQESVSLSGYSYSVSVPVIHYLLRNLIRRNELVNGNVKIVLRFSGHESPVLFTYIIPHIYPTPEMYQNGVETDLFMSERMNPNIKRMIPEVRRRVLEFITSENLYDALLIDEEEQITEGSKTNIFVVHNHAVITPPAGRVLKGVTRGKVIDLCIKLNYILLEETISINSLNKLEAAFFSGTSPGILPIRRIANHSFELPHPMVQALIQGYNEMINNYLHHW